MSVKFEQRLSTRHVRLSGNRSWAVTVWIASVAGLGISYLPFSDYWDSKLRRTVWIERQLVQKRLDRVLKFAYFVKSLEVRALDPLDYSQVSNLKHLRNLSFVAPIGGTLDLSDNSKLETLGCLNKTCNRITGISELSELRFVHLTSPSKSLLASLPTSIVGLFTRGKFDLEKVLDNLPNLRYLSLGRIRNLNINELSDRHFGIQELTLDDIGKIEGLEALPAVFPELKTLIVSRLNPEFACQVQILFQGLFRVEVQ